MPSLGYQWVTVANESTCAIIGAPMPANGKSLGSKETWVVGIGANGLEYTRISSKSEEKRLESLEILLRRAAGELSERLPMIVDAAALGPHSLDPAQVYPSNDCNIVFQIEAHGTWLHCLFLHNRRLVGAYPV